MTICTAHHLPNILKKSQFLSTRDILHSAMSTEVDEVKSKLNIIEIIGERVKLSKAGRNYKGLCPFHNEKTPSFMVSSDRQTFHCFGCGKGGSAFDFVMEFEHIDFAEALEELADRAGVTLAKRPQVAREDQIKQKLFEVNHLASEYYHYLLTSHKVGEKARQYLKNREISDKSIKTFMLGYSPNSWETLYRFLRKKGYEDFVLEQSGLVLRSNRSGGSGYYDRFRGRVMFTLKDHRGNVVGFAGRLLDPDAKEAKYINTSETPVYIKSNVLYGLDVTKAAIQKTKEAVVMEGEIDVISSFQAGVSNVVAIKGSALTEGHVTLLKRYTDKIILSLDSDLAGDAASRRGIEIADRAGLEIKVARLPQGKDPDELARANPVLLKKAISEAEPYYDYIIQSTIKRFDGKTAYGKKQMSNELVPMLVHIDNSIIQGHYVRIVADILEVSEQVVGEAMRRSARGIQEIVKKQEDKPAGTVSIYTRPDRLEVYLLGLLLQGKTQDFMEDLVERVQVADFSNLAVRRILELLFEFIKNNQVFLLKDFADSVPAELQATLDEAYLWDISQFIDNEDVFAKEWEKAVKEFRRLSLRRAMQSLSAQMTALSQEETPQPLIMAELTKKLHKVSDELTAIEKFD
jgi:DNA primase